MKKLFAAAVLAALAGCVETYGQPSGYVPQYQPMTFPTMQQNTRPMQPIQTGVTCRPIYGGGFQCI